MNFEWIRKINELIEGKWKQRGRRKWNKNIKREWNPKKIQTDKKVKQHSAMERNNMCKWRNMWRETNIFVYVEITKKRYDKHSSQQ